MANNEDDLDSVPDFEADNDFSEFEEAKAEQTLGGTIRNNPMIKLGLVAAGLIVVVGAIIMFGGQDEKPPNSVVGTSAEDLKEPPGTKELSPAMQEAMEVYNDQRTQDAIEQGSSVLPTPIEPPKDLMALPSEGATTEDPLQRWRQMQEERLRAQREQEQMQQQVGTSQQQDPNVAQAQEALAQAMSTQMAQILEERKIKNMTLMTVWNEEKAKESESNTGTTARDSLGREIGPDGQLLNREKLEIVIPAGAIVYGQLLNEANSDVEGPIVALLAQGPFSGSRVLGTFEREDELLVLEFNILVTKEGYSVPITTYALDPDTTLTGMATEVDHRYWRRIVLPAAARFIEGMGEAIAERGTTSVTVTDGSRTTSTQDNTDIDTEQEAAKGVEKAFERTAEILEDEGDDTEPLVIVKAGTPLGILFMQPVTKQDIENAQYQKAGDGASGGAGVPGNTGRFGNSLYGMAGQGRGNTMTMGRGVNAIPESLLQSLQDQQGLQNSGYNYPQQ